ncbi:enoyl-CoA hydratase/isomerase family protein [Paracoccus sp. (in: a-proteobacteria)]|uniref:enoyl-CoA hydratase/isomerase family protein n=1 Tax=Paracoccus sp. TaxID=267 RepID=UPI002B001AF4|nr:enoyl-CoA hydratase-related protein [Paracoccus sp. (in: a-proteobacteria)]
MNDYLIQEWPSDHVCVLRLNRPDQFNALSRALVQDLRDAVAGLAASKARVMVLAANGRGFCAGADLKERKIMSDDEKYTHNRAINALANEISALPIPTIAAINGIAMGGGCELSLACDLRFIADNAVIGLTEARIGAMPGAGGSQRLPRLIGIARALEMMYVGEPISAQKAEAWGLVNAVHPADELDARTMDFARPLSARSRRSTELLKTSVHRGIEVSLADGLEIERVAVAEILASRDYKEGLAAFAEKRAPNFE